MHAKTFLRTAITIPACAAIIAGSMVAPEFAYCATPKDMELPGLNLLACEHSTGENIFTLAILLLAEMAVAVIVARGAYRPVFAGLLASASSMLLAMVILQILFNLPLAALLDVSTVVACAVSATIGGATAWAANRWWPVAPKLG